MRKAMLQSRHDREGADRHHPLHRPRRLDRAAAARRRRAGAAHLQGAPPPAARGRRGARRARGEVARRRADGRLRLHRRRREVRHRHAAGVAAARPRASGWRSAPASTSARRSSTSRTTSARRSSSRGGCATAAARARFVRATSSCGCSTGAAADIQTKDLGPLDLKGITNPVPAVEIVYEHDPMALLRKLPFVGRARRVRGDAEEARRGAQRPRLRDPPRRRARHRQDAADGGVLRARVVRRDRHPRQLLRGRRRRAVRPVGGGAAFAHRADAGRRAARDARPRRAGHRRDDAGGPAAHPGPRGVAEARPGVGARAALREHRRLPPQRRRDRSRW